MREHRQGFCGTPLIRVLVVALLIIGQCPAFAAGLIMAASAGSDHSVSCSFDSREIKLVLAHRHDSAMPHRHTLAEQLILATGTNDQDHPDHRFRFVREISITSSGHIPLPEAIGHSIAAPFADQASDPWRNITSNPTPTPRPPPPPGPNSPTVLLQGVVMRR